MNERGVYIRMVSRMVLRENQGFSVIESEPRGKRKGLKSFIREKEGRRGPHQITVENPRRFFEGN
jgi:hypothetical protein